MKFTLTLHDYIQQYIINREMEHAHCPVCYDQVLVDNTKNNMAHILECYKQQVLLHMLQRSTRDDAQEIERLVMAAADQVCEEMITYFESHQNELDLDQHTL